MKKELIFIGEKANENEMEIKYKPDFYDALLLSKQSPQNAPYQSIHLRTNAKVSIHFSQNIKFTYQQHSWKIEGEKHLTEEEAFALFKSFAIREGKKVTYLAHGISTPQKVEKVRVLQESTSRTLNEI